MKKRFGDMTLDLDDVEEEVSKDAPNLKEDFHRIIDDLKKQDRNIDELRTTINMLRLESKLSTEVKEIKNQMLNLIRMVNLRGDGELPKDIIEKINLHSESISNLSNTVRELTERLKELQAENISVEERLNNLIEKKISELKFNYEMSINDKVDELQKSFEKTKEEINDLNSLAKYFINIIENLKFRGIIR